MGLTDNSVYWHYSSNSWNKNTRKNFENNSQEIALHLYIQYSRLIVLYTWCLVVLSTDTAIERSTSQIRSHTHSTLCISSAKSHSLSTIHSPHSVMRHTLTHREMTAPHLTVPWVLMLLIPCIRPSLLFYLALHIPFLYHPAALMLEAVQVTTVVGSIVPCYNIFL